MREESDVTASHTTQLRQILEDIDSRLLGLVTGPHPLGDAAIEKIATLEGARGAVQRLLDAGEKEAET